MYVVACTIKYFITKNSNFSRKSNNLLKFYCVPQCIPRAVSQ